MFSARHMTRSSSRLDLGPGSHSPPSPICIPNTCECAGGQEGERGETRPGWHPLCRIRGQSHTSKWCRGLIDNAPGLLMVGERATGQKSAAWICRIFSSFCLSSICRLFKLPSYLDVDIEVLLTSARVTGTPHCAFDLPVWLDFLDHPVPVRAHMCTRESSGTSPRRVSAGTKGPSVLSDCNIDHSGWPRARLKMTAKSTGSSCCDRAPPGFLKSREHFQTPWKKLFQNGTLCFANFGQWVEFGSCLSTLMVCGTFYV